MQAREAQPLALRPERLRFVAAAPDEAVLLSEVVAAPVRGPLPPEPERGPAQWCVPGRVQPPVQEAALPQALALGRQLA